MTFVVELNQILAFPLDPREKAEEIGLDWWAAKKLHDDGWLSFDPALERITTTGMEAEFTFLGTLVTWGCDPRLLGKLLKGLNPPYAYSLSGGYYDWISSKWKYLPEEKPLEQLVEEMIEDAWEENDIEDLLQLKATIDAAINSFKENM